MKNPAMQLRGSKGARPWGSTIPAKTKVKSIAGGKFVSFLVDIAAKDGRQ
jgi:hypothetical protein